MPRIRHLRYNTKYNIIEVKLISGSSKMIGKDNDKVNILNDILISFLTWLCYENGNSWFWINGEYRRKAWTQFGSSKNA